MTTEELRQALADIDVRQNHRVAVVRIVLDEEGHELGRIHRGAVCIHPGDAPWLPQTRA